jgi:hypothetical protein
MHRDVYRPAEARQLARAAFDGDFAQLVVMHRNEPRTGSTGR